MGFRKIETLTCLVREERWLKLTCQCGHEMLLNPLPLRSEFWKRRRSEALKDLHKTLFCGDCKERSFTVEHVPAQG